MIGKINKKVWNRKVGEIFMENLVLDFIKEVDFRGNVLSDFDVLESHLFLHSMPLEKRRGVFF
jgi:hypothetical protein